MNLVFATHNPNKLQELKQIVPEHIQLESLTEIHCNEEIIEDAPTIEGNAQLKARYITANYNKSCFADDTGLEVDFLAGAPGVYSARYAGEQKNSEDNIAKLLSELGETDNRKAQFKTVICLRMDDEEHLFTGICKGVITNKPSGESGFGYDPVFQPEGYDLTFAQMPSELKNKISHRGKAVQQLIDFLENNNYHKV